MAISFTGCMKREKPINSFWIGDMHIINKGNNNITEHRAIFQRERQNS